MATLSRWDRAGMLVSGACAVHCVLLPFLVAVLPVLGFERIMDGRVEWTLVGITATLGAAAHVRAFGRNHRHLAPGLIFACGLSLLLLGRAAVEPRWLEPFGLGLGGVLAAASHYANLRLCRCCRVCVAPAPEPGGATFRSNSSLNVTVGSR
jgi:hypothetical protein